MKWKIIFTLLLLFCFGLGFTVEWLPSYLKLYYTVVSLLICVGLTAKYAPDKYFLFGFLLGLAMCLSVTSRVLIFGYRLNPYWPVVAVVMTTVLGLMSFLSSKIIKKFTAKSTKVI